MRHFRLILLISLLATAFSQQQNSAPAKAQDSGGAILYSQGGAFLVAGPKGWIMDTKVGQQLGTCCVYYPQGSTWDDAATILYPSIVTKGPGQRTIDEFMASDLDDFRGHNPGMSFEEGSDLSLKNGRLAKIRYFYKVNHGSSEGVAYIDEDKIIALVVVSSRSKKGLNENLPQFRSALQTYAYMDVRFSKGADPGNKQAFQLPKD